MKTLGRVKKTNRGFELMKFKDLYGSDCSLQQSSIATENCIWLGGEHEHIHHVTQRSMGARMHLNRRMVKELVRRLSRWLETGSFR
jgi:hypothetical protein